MDSGDLKISPMGKFSLLSKLLGDPAWRTIFKP